MPALPIRTDLSAAELRQLARQEEDSRVALRLIAIANALDGLSREEAARRAGMDRQTLRDWVVRYNAEGVEGLRDRPRPGRPSLLDDGQLAVFRALVLRGPDPERDGLSAYRLSDLQVLLAERFGVAYSESGVWRLLESLDLRYMTVRPLHPQADLPAQEAFKKSFPHA